jgi:hypothetical protein
MGMNGEGTWAMRFLIPFIAFVLSYLNLFLGAAQISFGNFLGVDNPLLDQIPILGTSFFSLVGFLANPVAAFVLFYLIAKRTKIKVNGASVLSVTFSGALGYLLGASSGIIFAGAGRNLSTFLENSAFAATATGVDIAFVFLAAYAVAKLFSSGDEKVTE